MAEEPTAVFSLEAAINFLGLDPNDANVIYPVETVLIEAKEYETYNINMKIVWLLRDPFSGKQWAITTSFDQESGSVGIAAARDIPSHWDV